MKYLRRIWSAIRNKPIDLGPMESMANLQLKIGSVDFRIIELQFDNRDGRIVTIKAKEQCG